MTPKQEAKKLVQRFRNLENNDSWINNHNAKQCALICVNEIIKNLYILVTTTTNSVIDVGLGHWQEVKQEIINYEIF